MLYKLQKVLFLSLFQRNHMNKVAAKLSRALLTKYYCQKFILWVHILLFNCIHFTTYTFLNSFHSWKNTAMIYISQIKIFTQAKRAHGYCLSYSRLQNKHKGTLINFWKIVKKKKIKNDRNAKIDVKKY